MSGHQKGRIQHFSKGASRRACNGGTAANYRDATDLEDAARAINIINARKRRDGIEQRRQDRTAAITLPGGADLNAWLKKEVP